MPRKWSRLVSCLCLVAFLAANTHANVALAALVRGRLITPARPVPARADTCKGRPKAPATGCKHCARKAARAAAHAVPTPRCEERCPCGPSCPDCPKGPCCPENPCPGGCALCSVAKAPSLPSLPPSALEVRCTGTITQAGDPDRALTCPNHLFRPPRA
jgi:hypothetical protein